MHEVLNDEKNSINIFTATERLVAELREANGKRRQGEWAVDSTGTIICELDNSDGIHSSVT